MERIYNRKIKKYDGTEIEFKFDDERPIQEQIDTRKCRYKKHMMFHVPKIHSSVFKQYREGCELKIEASYEELIQNGCIASLADNQMLKTLRETSNHPFEKDVYNGFKKALKVAEKRNDMEAINSIRANIAEQQYMPEYLIIVFDNVKDYEDLFKYEEITQENAIRELRCNLPEGDERKLNESKYIKPRSKRIVFNGHTYTRLTCGAAQARKSIVVYCDERYTDKVLDTLNAGRNVNAKMAASKFNAYLGLYSSASRKVTMPRIAIIGAYETKERVHTMYEVPWDKIVDENGNQKYSEEEEYFKVDSILEDVEKEETFNRFDGGGIIRPEMALQWAYDLGLDYVPANFCIRYTFTKGAVACFDFVKWCKEENNGEFIIKDIFGNEFDVREKDIIITEDMAKMIKQWNSVEDYIECSDNAGIDMRITKYAPKEDRTYNTLNYQYIQTLNWKNGIDKNGNKAFPDDWEQIIKSVGYEEAVKMGYEDKDLHDLANISIEHYSDIFKDPVKRRLFLCGNQDPLDILRGEDSFAKAMYLFPSIMNTSEAKRKIRDNIGNAVNDAKLGKGLERANYQCLVPDSYAFCEFMAEKEVRGLLPKTNDDTISCYSAFWNNHGATKVSLARSPQTYRSEWVKCNLINNERTNKWYMHQYSGFITPIYGAYTLELAGSDFDYDIGYTTDDPIIYNKIYEGKPVTSYDVPKPAKIDLKTGKYAYTIKEKNTLNVKNMKEELMYMDTKSFGQQIGQITNNSTTFYALQTRFKEGSPEYNLLENRLMQLCIAQSKQIDKTKIGKEVKSIPNEWYGNTGDPVKDAVSITPGGRCKPYFMIYRYPDLMKYIKEWGEGAYGNKKCEIISDPCPMNRFCWYIESELSDERLDRLYEKNTNKFEWSIMLSEVGIDDSKYQIVKKIMDNKINFINGSISLRNRLEKDDENNYVKNASREKSLEALKFELLNYVGDIDMVINCLVKYFYGEAGNKTKGIFWEMVGEEVITNMLNNVSFLSLPVKDDKGSIDYLFDKYAMKNFTSEEIKEIFYERSV